MAETYGLESLGLKDIKAVHRNLSAADLVERALARGEGQLAANGAFNVTTGKYTGRSPNDKFLVEEPGTKDDIWWGPINFPIPPETFDKLCEKVAARLSGRELYMFDGFAGADPDYRLNVRVVSEKAWHALFARTLFLRSTQSDPAAGQPDFTILNASEVLAEGEADGVRSEAFVLVNFAKKLVIIGGTHYGGEMKKSIFGILNFILPAKGVLPMHCSANVGQAGDAALFFGLSGTGKTTLSADPDRRLIGDDEHGWSDKGVFNFEGGCYAKTVRLSKEGEPQIWNAIRFGSLLENVVIDPATRVPDYDDVSLTENTRVTYPVEFIEGCVIPGVGPHPKNVMFLTCDAYGVLPPISRLSPAQAMYHFLSGYTAKVAGTERGVTEPTATFSACFGSPFLPRHPTVYAKMLGERLEKHGAACWLVNTGWNGTGKRMKLAHTRALVTAALTGKLDSVEYRDDAIFGLAVPQSCPDVPGEILNIEQTWDDKDAYRQKAKQLAGLFAENFKESGEGADPEVAAAGPNIGGA